MTALAAKTGLSQQMVSYVERELRNPSLDTLLRITAGLGIRLSDTAVQIGGRRRIEGLILGAFST